MLLWYLISKNHNNWEISKYLAPNLTLALGRLTNLGKSSTILQRWLKWPVTFQDNTGLTQPSVRSEYLCDDQIQELQECVIRSVCYTRKININWFLSWFKRKVQVFLRRPQKIDKNSQFLLCLLSKYRSNWEIFLAFLETLIFIKSVEMCF